MTGAQGFLLLTIDRVNLASTSPNYPTIPIGLLSLECVTIPMVENADPNERDVWLVLRIDPPEQSAKLSGASLELALPATQHIVLNRSINTYTLPLTGPGAVYGDATLTVTLPTPSTPSLKEDYETLEVIFAQYAVLQTIAPPSGPPPTSATGVAHPGGPDGDLKGRLILVDDENGQVIGELSDNVQIHEDDAMRSPPNGHEKDPVVVELRDEKEDGKTGAFVHPITVDESDFVMHTAGLVSKGIVFVTNVLSSGMSSAASYYIAHSEPTKDPVVFSDTTRQNFRRVHKISGQAVNVTSKTTGMIHKAVEQLTDRVAGRSSSSYSTPALPPRNKGSLSPSGFTSPYPGSPSPRSTSPAPPPPPPRKKPALVNRVLASTDLLLTTVEQSAQYLISNGTQNMSRAMEHKYGPDASQAALHMGNMVRNVSMVYIDVRGVGRRALLRKAGKRVVFGSRRQGKDGKMETVQQEVIFDDGGNPHLTETPTPPPALPQRSYTMPPPGPPPGYMPK
jgi:spartin